MTVKTLKLKLLKTAKSDLTTFASKVFKIYGCANVHIPSIYSAENPLVVLSQARDFCRHFETMKK